jgi:D-beta-D-heptose 7-phosphate kinase / D-beta-D-heptose 1-phosphate adenosyltransferase
MLSTGPASSRMNAPDDVGAPEQLDVASLKWLLDRVAGCRVACVGDLMVDRFVYGEVTRISPEAPIPVLRRTTERTMLGAAGNVARNVVALGGSAALAGLIGADAHGADVLRLVGDEPSIEGYLITDPERTTTLKSRFVSGAQQLLRVDLDESRPATGEAEDRLIRTVRGLAQDCAVILMSDYGKGVVTDAVIAACRAAARASGARLVVDSKARSFARYGAVDLIKPNALELANATGLPTGSDAEVEAALSHALALCDAHAILVTRAAKGMSLAVRGRAIRHFPTLPREVFDVSGAGDTALAALGLALAADAPIEDGVAFAQLAAAVAVNKVGTATVAPEELVEAVINARYTPMEAKIVNAQRMVQETERWRVKGLRIGFTNGCFDVLHKGHIAYLAEARTWCDRLIVGLNSDSSIKALKGLGRPVNNLDSRALVLAGLQSVDLVVPFEDATPTKLIQAARPDVLVKGDYVRDQVVGGDLVEAWGGEVRLAKVVEGYSTTAAIARMAQADSGRAQA